MINMNLRNLAALVFLLGACTAVTPAPTPPPPATSPATAQPTWTPQASPTPYPSSTPYSVAPTYTPAPSPTAYPSPLPFPLGVRVPRARVLPVSVAYYREYQCYVSHFYSVSDEHQTTITEDGVGYTACTKGTGAGVSR